ncbi:hypothetical protein ONZ45_g13519 [Pleurotus djamor]|nr:hypothetical protein ONZ45_g13519 [Pleurotus djamor]
MSVVKSEWSRFGTCKGVREAPPKPAPLPCKPHAYWAESDDEFAHVGSGSESDDDREKIKRADAADQWDGSYLHHDRDLPSYTVVEEDNEDDVYDSDSSQSDGESSDAEEEKEVTAKVMEKGKARSIEATIVAKTVRNNEGSSGEETDESGYASNDGYESNSDDGYIPAPRARRRRVRNLIEISDDTENEESTPVASSSSSSRTTRKKNGAMPQWASPSKSRLHRTLSNGFEQEDEAVNGEASKPASSSTRKRKASAMSSGAAGGVKEEQRVVGKRRTKKLKLSS